MPELLTFNDAVIITNQLIAYWNSPKSDYTILFLADRFNLKVKPDFTVRVNSINRNCPECSGNVCGETILGCYETHMRDKPGNLCYWDKALEKILGTRLIVHEVGHVIYDQIFDDGLSDQESFNQSEKFAMFMESHFDLNMNYFGETHNETLTISPRLSNIFQAIIIGVVISAASIGIAEYVRVKREKKIRIQTA